MKYIILTVLLLLAAPLWQVL